MTPDRPDADIHADGVGKTTCPQCGYVLDLTGVAPFRVVQCPKCDVKFAAPGRLGPFILFHALGKGEMGATYKALEKGLGRFVAVKVMRSSLVRDKKRADDFFAEARAVASLEHPNAVRLYSVGQEKGQPYIVMELIKGQAMDKAFSASEPMDEDRALAIAIGVARGLKAAEEIGLVHGDVKPANIMLDENDTPKLVDFGIAKFGGARGGEDGIIGTPYYVAPEAVRKEAVDCRGDMYSLGATLYHALTGSPPFPGTSMEEVLHARLERPAPNLLDARPEIHPKTAAVVARMLAADPGDRHATYAELLEDLQQAYFQVTGLEMPELQAVVGRPEIPVAAPVSASRAWLIGGLVAAAVLVAGAVALWAIWLRDASSRVPPPPPVVRRVEAPVFSPPQRTIAAPTAIRITCETPLARVHYTTDGGEPTEGSALYQTPVHVRPGTTLKARAFRDGLKASAIVEALYARDSTVLADVVPIRTAVGKAWQRVSKLDAGQGFAPKLERCDTLLRNAEELYRQAAYGAARRLYEELLATCRQLEKLEAQRVLAKAARDQAVSAKETLERAGGGKGPNPPWRQAEQAAKAAFDDGRFEQARQQWEIVKAHVGAGLTALAGEARGDWERALAKVDSEKLNAFGGGQWREVQKSLAGARRAERRKKPGEAIDGYRDALRRLPRAVEEADLAAAEAKINEQLDRARTLMKRGHYDKALAEVGAVLAVRGKHRAARDLKEQIAKKITLRLDLGRWTAIELRWVPAGKFLMGSPRTEIGHQRDEFRHEVEITRPFYIGKYEVSRKEFQAFKDAKKGYKTLAEREKWAWALEQGKWARRPNIRWSSPGFRQDNDEPVTCVAWRDAVMFCQWASDKTRRTVRLPTEAEWEYACRAGTTTRFSFGEKDEDLHKHGNYADQSAAEILPRVDRKHNDGHKRTAPPRSYQPNRWRLYHMHGNVAEWCLDHYGAYSTEAVRDPKGPERGTARLARGGSWDRPAAMCRSACRQRLPEAYRAGNVGFRIVVEIE